MKIVMRNWKGLVGFVAAGLICVTYLLAQTQTTSTTSIALHTQTPSNTDMMVTAPGAQETADAERLIQAVNAGEAQSALEILHAYGVADNTLLSMATHLDKPVAPVALKEPFLEATVGRAAVASRLIKTNLQDYLDPSVVSGFERPVWMPRRPNTWATASFDADLLHCPDAPIMVLNLRFNDRCFIRYFKLYERYADYVHSVVLNGPNLTNAKLDPTNYTDAANMLNALFQLIKARNPDAFVWLQVVKEDSHSDGTWLRAMTFQPDGLYISNLRQFNSPFAQTRVRYLAIMGTNMPMMVAGFYGEKAALRQTRNVLVAAITNGDPNVRQVTEAVARQKIGGIGAAVETDLSQVITNLQMLGYRGISVHWLLLAAMANSRNAAPSDRADLLDPRSGLLDIYFDQGSYSNVLSLAANMISNSAPGDMDWTVGKLYEGITWLSQTPRDTKDATSVLDEIINFNFGNLPGRDHYIIGAVKWRIYAANLSGDTQTSRRLEDWVQNQPLRTDLKSDFLKQYSNNQTSAKSQ